MNGKCYLTPTASHPCRAMADRMTDSHGAGIHLVETFHMDTMERTVQGFVFKRNVRDQGLMLNYCPWCGAKLIENRRPIYAEVQAEGEVQP